MNLLLLLLLFNFRRKTWYTLKDLLKVCVIIDQGLAVVTVYKIAINSCELCVCICAAWTRDSSRSVGRYICWSSEEQTYMLICNIYRSCFTHHYHNHFILFRFFLSFNLFSLLFASFHLIVWYVCRAETEQVQKKKKYVENVRFLSIHPWSCILNVDDRFKNRVEQKMFGFSIQNPLNELVWVCALEAKSKPKWCA